ncbi:MAG: hypothetical protein ACI8ZW_002288, partial [Yoonia sp.]
MPTGTLTLQRREADVMSEYFYLYRHASWLVIHTFVALVCPLITATSITFQAADLDPREYQQHP